MKKTVARTLLTQVLLLGSFGVLWGQQDNASQAPPDNTKSTGGTAARPSPRLTSRKKTRRTGNWRRKSGVQW